MNFVRTHLGLDVALSDPNPDTVDIRDIAHHLALLPRFNGATVFPYSVAQHSVVVSRILGRRHDAAVQMAGLMHDACEAYLGDITRPVKREIERRAGSNVIEVLENQLTARICEFFRISYTPEIHKLVQAADDAALTAEWKCLMPGKVPWSTRTETVEVAIAPWTRDKAEQTFIETFQKLDALRSMAPGGITK